MKDGDLAEDATVKKMNDLSVRLHEMRSKAYGEIVACECPIDIYNDLAWYPDLDDVLAARNKSHKTYKKPTHYERAKKMREAMVEIDILLISMDHYARFDSNVVPSNEVDAIIDGLEASIDAITAFFTLDADIGRRQLAYGRKAAKNKDHLSKAHANHRRWLEEAKELKINKPGLSVNAMAIHICQRHNERLKLGENSIKSETVRSIIKYINK